MAEGVAAGEFVDFGGSYRFLHGSLHLSLVEVVATELSRVGVVVRTGGRENPLPRQALCTVGVFSGKGVGERHAASASADVFVVSPLPTFELDPQWFLSRRVGSRHDIAQAASRAPSVWRASSAPR